MLECPCNKIPCHYENLGEKKTDNVKFQAKISTEAWGLNSFTLSIVNPV